jgi:hypothetical protein
MIIFHRISLRPTDKQRHELEALGMKLPSGVALPGGGAPHVAFDVEERHPNWDALQRLFQAWDVGDFVNTRFSADEISEAAWLEFVPEWHHGYPQPEADLGFLRTTYDTVDWCPDCGVGLKQKAPFQMKGEPRWGRRAILQLNWVFDEFFVTPEVWSSVFEPSGITFRPVTNGKGATLKNVVQLAVEEQVGISIAGLTPQRCAKCGRVKYTPLTRGFFPALSGLPTCAIVKTKEYFGSGTTAHQRVLVSQDVARALAQAGVRGASLKPVAEPK